MFSLNRLRRLTSRSSKWWKLSPIFGARDANKRLEILLDMMRLHAQTEKQVARVLDRVLQDLVRPYHHGMFWGDRMLLLDRAAEFRSDPKFKEALKSADSATGQNQYASPDGVSWRFNTLIWAARICLPLEGDFVECGVYRGDMTWMITETVDVNGAGKKFYIYDTFTGFDPKYSSEADFPAAPHFFAAADSDYRIPDLDVVVRQRFAEKPYVVVVKGTVPDVLGAAAPTKVAFLHLDMNSAAAETGALEALFDRISPGGIVVFDDYGWTLHAPQKKAADKFAASRGGVILELPTGQGLLIKRQRRV